MDMSRLEELLTLPAITHVLSVCNRVEAGARHGEDRIGGALRTRCMRVVLELRLYM